MSHPAYELTCLKEDRGGEDEVEVEVDEGGIIAAVVTLSILFLQLQLLLLLHCKL